MSVKIKTKFGGYIKTISNVMYVPNLSVNLLSISEVKKVTSLHLMQMDVKFTITVIL